MDMKTIEIVSKIAQLLAGEQQASPSPLEPDNRVGKKVLVRTYSAGVHFGTLKSRDGEEVTLENARRIWSWKGANTLNEIANRGVDQSESNVSEPVSEIDLANAIEVIPLTAVAATNLEGCRWRNK